MPSGAQGKEAVQLAPSCLEVAAGGTGGALAAAPLSDFLGRKMAVTLASGLFLAGCAMQEVPNLGIFYAGRFLGGLAIGATSMLAPQYLAENAPKSVRGSLTTSYNLMIVVALALAFWTNYGVSKWPQDPDNHMQWQLALGIQLIPGAFLFVLIWFVIETPRALISKGKRELSLRNLCKLRGLPENHPYVRGEYLEICAQADAEQEKAKGQSYAIIVKEILFVASNRRRLFLAVALFVFHELTGTDSLNYFAPQIFSMVGVPRGSGSLLTTGVYGIVKVVTTLAYVTIIVDRIGRRLPLIVEALIQGTAMLYLALFIKFAKPEEGGGTSAGGIVGVVWIYAYAFGWSFGHCVAPYVVAAEIFPARIRSVCMAICLFSNWIVNYGITSATPHMIRRLLTCHAEHQMEWGTFLFFAISTYVGVGFVYLCLPELKGRSLESMDDLFDRSIWTMWNHAYPTEDEKVRHGIQDLLDRDPKLQGLDDDEAKSSAAHKETKV
ncbi:hypothetical protein PG984_008161 [Apiospora sp. TS-2023a]